MPANPPGKRQFNVYLSVDLVRKLKLHAVATEQSLSAIVEAALATYLEQADSASTREDDHVN